MPRTAILAVALSFALILPAGAEDAGNATDSFKKGNYAEAFKKWQPLAAKGDAASQFNLGLMYETGRGVKKDPAKALIWYRKAAKQGHARAKNNIRMIHTNDRGATVKGESASRSGDYRIQLISVGSKDRAKKEAARLAMAHKSVLGGLELFLVPANLGEKGIVHRVRAGPLRDRAAAEALCRQLVARDQGCLVIDP
ncbi:MAG TPA: SPOR domain-containing protein [Alphaproteobacteria bacterium]|nr:SPOR domain-containing protein [Alphaproteobacteria bacterium]